MLLLTVFVAVAGKAVQAGETVDGESSFTEDAVPSVIVLPAGATSPVELIDDLTGLSIPLAGEGESRDDGRLGIAVPQLPPGEFTARWRGGEKTIRVFDSKGSDFAYSRRGGEGSSTPVVPLLMLLGGLGCGVLLLAKKRRAVGLLVIAGSFGFSGVAWIATGEAPVTYGQSAWEACNLEQKEEIKLNCKVEVVLDHIDAGRFDTLREMVVSNRDPVCHEVSHRASFHTWRLTRDRELVKNVLLPGCDDGLIHGVAESIATFTSDSELAGELIGFCTSAEQDFQMRACMHGGGHATIWRTNGDIERAWELCKQIPKDAIAGYDASEECMGSSVMEWSDRWSAEKGREQKTVKPDLAEPMELCLRGPETYTFRLECYMGTNHRTGDAKQAAEWCIRKEADIQLDACFSALGENLPYYEAPRVTIELVPEMAVRHAGNCLLAPTGGARDACMSALSRVFAVMKVSKTLALDVCDSVDAQLETACLKGIKDAELKFEQRGIELP